MVDAAGGGRSRSGGRSRIIQRTRSSSLSPSLDIRRARRISWYSVYLLYWYKSANTHAMCAPQEPASSQHTGVCHVRSHKHKYDLPPPNTQPARPRSTSPTTMRSIVSRTEETRRVGSASRAERVESHHHHRHHVRPFSSLLLRPLTLTLAGMCSVFLSLPPFLCSSFFPLFPPRSQPSPHTLFPRFCADLLLCSPASTHFALP